MQVSTFEVLYREGDHEMAIEMDFRDPTPVLYGSAVGRWRYPHEAEPLSDADRQRVIDRVSRHLADDRGFTFVTDLDH